MKRSLTLLFSGQGSQYVGMGTNCQYSLRSLERASDILSKDLTSLCLDGPSEKLNLTENTQPAIVALSLGQFDKLKVWCRQHQLEINLIMGHSVGEISALVAAEVFSFEQAIKLVETRAKAMQQACPPNLGAMFAILKIDAGKLESLCQKISREDHLVVCANYNDKSQTVISGHRTACEELVENLKQSEERFRAVELPVSAPFHSPLMASAGEAMRKHLSKMNLGATKMDWTSNVDAQTYSVGTGPEVVTDNLIRQASSPVLWWQSMKTIPKDSACFELGPGGSLTQLTKRTRPDLKIRPVDQLDLENLSPEEIW